MNPAAKHGHLGHHSPAGVSKYLENCVCVSLAERRCDHVDYLVLSVWRSCNWKCVYVSVVTWINGKAVTVACDDLFDWINNGLLQILFLCLCVFVVCVSRSVRKRFGFLMKCYVQYNYSPILEKEMQFFAFDKYFIKQVNKKYVLTVALGTIFNAGFDQWDFFLKIFWPIYN